MNIDINGLQAFARVAELGSFHQAAEALFVTPSALSRRIKKIEDDVGLRLLDRTSRQVRLTTVGQQFLPQAHRLIDELERSILNLRDVAKHGYGQVVFACIPTAAHSMLTSVMKEYIANFPRNGIRILDCRAYEATQMLLRREVEFAITILRGPVEQEIDVETLFKDPFVLACRRDHPLAKRRKISWQDMKGQQIIGVGRMSGNYTSFDGAPGSIMRGHWLYEVQQSFTTGLDMAESGIGAIVIPRLAFVPSRHPKLVSRPLVNPIVTRTLCVAWRKDATLSPAAVEFLQLLRLRWAQISKRST